MSEQTNLAAKVHEILANRNLGADAKIAEIEAMFPAPPRPTLADMTEEERAACQWMQCEVTGFQGQWALATLCDDDDEAVLVAACGEICWSSPAQVTPRPDLPPLPWPGTEKPAPAPAPALPEGWRLAEHQTRGRVIVTRPKPDNDGDVVIVCSHPDWGTRAEMIFCKPAELTYIDAEPGVDTVPPNTLAEGSVWHDADALTGACEETGRDQITVTDRNGNVSVWDARRDVWRGHWSIIPKYAPFTIIHAGKGADQ